MSKTLKRWDTHNPIYIFNQEVAKVKKALRLLDGRSLPMVCKQFGVTNETTLTGPRGKLIRAALAAFSEDFKVKWEANYGWPLSDGRDSHKLALHRQAFKVKKQEDYNQQLKEAFLPFVDNAHNNDLAIQLRSIALSVAGKHQIASIPTNDNIYKLLDEAKNDKFETAKANNEIPAEVISWQKAKKLLGVDGYRVAKDDGKALTEDGTKISYLGKKWYLHA